MAKRIFDIIMSVIVLACFAPFGILIALLILSESRGGVFYRQQRIGRNGVPFRLFKFRTMKVNADKQGLLTVGMRDSRITRVGYLIRKYKLDEFPQFINVLTGDMSIIGPRPEVQEYVDYYTQEQRRVLEVRPGITDYASIAYFDENKILGEAADPKHTYINQVMPAKLELNRKYIENPGLRQDLHIMWLTFLKIIGR